MNILLEYNHIFCILFYSELTILLTTAINYLFYNSDRSLLGELYAIGVKSNIFVVIMSFG